MLFQQGQQLSWQMNFVSATGTVLTEDENTKFVDEFHRHLAVKHRCLYRRIYFLKHDAHSIHFGMYIWGSGGLISIEFTGVACDV